MALRASPFPNQFVAGIHAIGWAFILPCFWFLDRLIAVCKSTTLEQTQRMEQECYLHPLKVFFGSITFFILFLATAPLAFIGFLLWAPLQAYRRPFCYHQETTPCSEKDTRRSLELETRTSFGFATANLCLLPDSLARFNNLGHTQYRATAIGQRIAQGVCRPNIRIFVDSPSSCGTLSPSNSTLPTAQPSVGDLADSSEVHSSAPTSSDHVVSVPCDDTEEPSLESYSAFNSNQNSNQQGQTGHRSAPRALLSQGLGQQGSVPWEVSSLFPANVDLLCLEEVFDKRAAKKLTQTLKPVFRHILYDVGVYACQPPCTCTHFKFFNSGLFLASRFPVLEAQYHFFPNSRGEDALAAKGLLATKVRPTINTGSDAFALVIFVLLASMNADKLCWISQVLIGENRDKKKVVGYFNCTHLHAPEGKFTFFLSCQQEENTDVQLCVTVGVWVSCP